MSIKKNRKPDTVTKKALPFYIGTYSDTGPYVPEANGEGVLLCTLDLSSGQIKKNSVCREAINSTYLDKSPDGNFLFVACDMFSSDGNIQALSINPQGAPAVVSSQNSHGKSTCHITCDREGKMIFASSYVDAKLAVYRFEGNRLSPAVRIISYEGSGSNPDRQEQAHAHQALVSRNNKWLYVCDLGSDKIWVHDLSDLFDNTRDMRNIEVPAGYGPRHMVWSSKLPKAYILCELNSHILVYDRDDKTGMMELIEDKPALPKEYKGEAAGSAIRLHPGNKTLYVSDRGQNSIIVHTIDETSGRLTFEGWFSIKGKTPRDFGIDPTGQWLLSANQDSDTIIPFRLNPESGLPTGEAGPPFACGTPVCVLF